MAGTTGFYLGFNRLLLFFLRSFLLFLLRSDGQKIALAIVIGEYCSSFFHFAFQNFLSYRIFKNHNQYLMLQWFGGYAESLINYNKSVNMLRVGIILKPSKFVFY